jgi:hypothetical protein
MLALRLIAIAYGNCARGLAQVLRAQKWCLLRMTSGADAATVSS